MANTFVSPGQPAVSVKFSGDRLKRFSKGILTMSEELKQQIRSATFYCQSVVVKEFLSVSDGDPKSLRTFGPGLRAPTGFLRNNVRTDFRERGLVFEGAVGTNVPYGRIHEERYRSGRTNNRGFSFGFLQPGLEKAMPRIKEQFHGAVVGRMNSFNG